MEGLSAFELGRVPENILHYVLAFPALTADFPWIGHVGWPPAEKVTRLEDVSSIFLISPFLLLGILSWPLLKWRKNQEIDLPVFTTAIVLSSGLAFFAILCFAAAARRYAHDFVPVWMVLAFIGAGLHGRQITVLWNRWAWAGVGDRRSLCVTAYASVIHAVFRVGPTGSQRHEELRGRQPRSPAVHANRPELERKRGDHSQ